jgi:hypothetical protein
MNKKNVFVDHHHASLLNSFILFFEGFLGGNVYRPIGIEWAEKGYWKVYDHPATQAQFLHVGGATPDGTQPVNEVIDNPIPGLYHCQDIDSGYYNKAITFDLFMALPIDIIIASIPAHVEPFFKLSKLHPNKPKCIYQIGNAWDVPADIPIKNIMASATLGNIPSGYNVVSYHQEFDTNIFSPDFSLSPDKNVYSFINCFNIQSHFAGDWQLFINVEKQLPDYKFRAYGGQCRDGASHGSKALAETIKEARFIWHTKNGGDGYGHIIHNVPACGRPLLVKRQYYNGKMAERLLVDGVSCIAIDGMTPPEIANKIKWYSDPARYTDLCIGAHRVFTETVDFKSEHKLLLNFIEKLI